MQQLIVRSAGSALLSARELETAVKAASAALRADHDVMGAPARTRLAETLTESEKERMRRLAADADAMRENPDGGRK